MLKIHHLNNSRSQRIIWLCEELGLDYELVKYQRDADTRLAPDSLKAVHPLGKSPLIEDGGKMIAESGAIVDYLIRTYGEGKLMPSMGTDEYEQYNEWLHFAEGSAMLPFLLGLYTRMLGEAAAPLLPRIQSEVVSHLTYMATRLGEQPFMMGQELTGADIMQSFVLEAAAAGGALSHFPNLNAYLERLQTREAYQRSIERGGPYQLGA